MKPCHFFAAAFMLLANVFAASAAPEFFVLDNGVGRGSWSPEQQARTLKELGYGGISYNYTNPEDLAAWQKSFREQGLKIHGLYVSTFLDGPQPYDPRLPEAIRMLKGSDTVLWMTIRETKRQGDLETDAVKLIQQLAYLCQESGVRLVLYGHVGFYMANAADTVRLAGKAGKPNVSTTINLCHEFLGGRGGQLDETLRIASPSSSMATINGVDPADNKRYILRLDQGDFDMVAYLQKLQAAGYHGPVGLQCYSVPGDIRENLAANIATWRRISAQVEEKSASAPPQNILTPEETAAGWKLLFDGKTTEGWHGFQKTSFPGQGWTVENGCLKCLGHKGGDLLTSKKFTDFEFAWEWRLSFQGNTGVKYFVDENRTNERGAIGHEYQMIDDANFVAEPLNGKKVTGAWYDVLPPMNAKARPPGEFNQSRLVVRGNKVEHWLNGERVLAYQADGPEAAAGIAQSKFKDVPGYADRIPTPILLQDHETVVWFRNLKLRELPGR